jgi:hypothetical protein
LLTAPASASRNSWNISLLGSKACGEGVKCGTGRQNNNWAAATLLDTTSDKAQELLEALADARLLEVTRPDEAGQRRYRFHDLVRIYATGLAEAEGHLRWCR